MKCYWAICENRTHANEDTTHYATTTTIPPCSWRGRIRTYTISIYFSIEIQSLASCQLLYSPIKGKQYVKDQKVVEEGFEPPFRSPKLRVLPLDDSTLYRNKKKKREIEINQLPLHS